MLYDWGEKQWLYQMYNNSCINRSSADNHVHQTDSSRSSRIYRNQQNFPVLTPYLTIMFCCSTNNLKTHNYSFWISKYKFSHDLFQNSCRLKANFICMLQKWSYIYYIFIICSKKKRTWNQACAQKDMFLPQVSMMLPLFKLFVT